MCCIYHDVQYLSRCVVSITMCSIYHDVQYLSRCAVSTTMCSIYHDVQYLSRCAVSITMCSIYHDARFRERRLVHKRFEFTRKGTHISRTHAQDLQATIKQTEQSGTNRNARDFRTTAGPGHFVSSSS